MLRGPLISKWCPLPHEHVHRQPLLNCTFPIFAQLFPLHDRFDSSITPPLPGKQLHLMHMRPKRLWQRGGSERERVVLKRGIPWFNPGPSGPTVRIQDTAVGRFRSRNADLRPGRPFSFDHIDPKKCLNELMCYMQQLFDYCLHQVCRRCRTGKLLSLYFPGFKGTAGL